MGFPHPALALPILAVQAMQGDGMEMKLAECLVDVLGQGRVVSKGEVAGISEGIGWALREAA